MTNKISQDLFSQALNLSEPWYVKDIDFSQDQGRLDIYIDFPTGSVFKCPDCGNTGIKAYDTDRDRTWRHLDFFQHKAYIHCRVPRVKCSRCGVKTVAVPWARPGVGFTLLFEAFALVLVRDMPVKAAARILREHDTRIWRVLHYYVQYARRKENFSEVSQIGTDETSWKKRHQYVSVFVDLKESRTIYVTPGRDHTTLKSFRNDFEEHGGSIKQVKDFCIDMSPAFKVGVEEYFPEAAITYDRFHVMKIMNQALDEVRRQEQAKNDHLRNSRFVWLKNPERLTEKQRNTLNDLTIMNLKTARAYRLRLTLREFWEQPAELAELFLKKWYFMATHSRLQPVIEAARTIKRHWVGIINYHKSRINNGILEGMNSLIQAARAKAKGYRSVENFITIIYLVTGKLKFDLPT
jgi:transposase